MAQRIPTLPLIVASVIGMVTAQETPTDFSTEFSQLDTDGNGRLSLAEAGPRAALVRSADADQSGDVTLAELRAFLRERRSRVVTPDPDAKPKIREGTIPANAPISLASCRAAAAYSARQNGYSFLVMLNGEVVFERYDQGWTPRTPHRLASGTKSFSGALLAAAVKDELLTLDERLSETLTDWKSDPRLAKITYRHLLSLTSGIEPGGIGRVPSYRDAVAGVEVRHPAGSRFAYGPNPYQVFGEALRRKLATREDLDFSDPLAYLKSRLLEPIGMEIAEWRRDADGMPMLPSGAFVTAREWAKFGELLRREGNWEGQSLLDAETLDACRVGSEANPGYGLTFWLLGAQDVTTDEAPGLENADREPPLPALADAYMAAGAGKQRLYLLPRQGLVIVRQGESRKFEDRELLERLLSTNP